VLGTKGAIIGDWDESGEGAVADLPAIISVYGQDQEQQIVDYVEVEPYSFHKSLAAYFHDDVAMSVNAQQSRDVVAIMQAAEASALKNGLPVTPSLLR